MSKRQGSSTTFVVVTASLVIVAAATAALYVREAEKTRKHAEEQQQDLGPLSSNPALNEAFRKAVARAPTILEHASTGDKLAMYALYKQATVGDLPRDEPAPSRIFMERYYKHLARSKLRGMSREIAMTHYIEGLDMVQQLGDANQETGGMGAPRVSTLVQDDESDEDDGETSLEQQLRSAVSSCSSTDKKKNKQSISDVEALLSRGADPNDPDDSGQTALHFAADRGSLECLKLLLNKGANVNAADEEGISVLQAAVIGGNVHAVKLLLEHGADPDQQDMDGDTPRSCAQDDGSNGMKELFSAIGALKRVY